MTLYTGEYIIVNKSTGLALDGNAEGASHLSHDHKRPFLWQPVHTAANHKWIVEKQPNGNYLLKTRANNQERALDGNVNVPQTNPQHPQPFLYTPVPSAANHRWSLQPVHGDANTFVIVNESNNLALDGNVNGIAHHDANHKAPFLWQPVHTAPNHQWIFHPVGVPSGKYMIVNKSTGLALDGNVNGASHQSHQHKRPFVWNPVPTAHNHYWNVKHVHGDEYLITTDAAGPEHALDGNTNVPQINSSHPQPFLYTPVPSAANHRWRFVPAQGEPNTFTLVNVANNLALDGNVNGIAHHDANHKAPFLWTPVYTAPNHKWELRRQH